MHNKDACSPSSNGGYGAGAGQMQSNSAAAFASFYSALLNENIPPSISAGCSKVGGGVVSLYPYSSDSRTQSHGYDSCFIQKHQDMVNRHSMCVTRLVETLKEVEALKQENTQLRAMNKELRKNLNLVIQASVESQFGGVVDTQTSPFDVAHGFHIGEGKENYADWNMNMNINNNNNNSKNEKVEGSEESPTSVIENNGVEVERFALPKSISVRSNGYLKIAQSGAPVPTNTVPTRAKGATRPRASSTAASDAVQKVYVRGGEKEEEPLEMVVYNQGMFKTELCNKWQETGTCPSGDHYQFTHGIGELRPVIRHPRYKTEVCRMVLAGVVCPYGYRCHFRHALTEQEKALSQSKPRAKKLDR